MRSVKVGHRTLHDLCEAIFVAAGVQKTEADCVSSHLVRANLTGHDSHGVGRVPRYVQMLSKGLVFAGRSVSVLSQSDTHLHLDGNSGFGQSIGEQAVDMGCDRALAHGIAIVALGNSGHVGRVGDWAERAAAAGLASIHMVSVRGRSLVAPFGGIDRRLSTSPLCIGVPTGGHPVIHDFATSTIAEGKALVAAQGGKPLPADALISDTGQLTNDPAVLYGETITAPVPDAAKGPGALTTFGAHKGSGLSIMIELLAGGLSGTGVNRTFLDVDEAPFRNAMLSIYLDPDRFAGREYLAGQADALADYIHGARPAQGHDQVLMPGETEVRTEADRRANGLPLSQGLWDQLTTSAIELGVAIPLVRAAEG